MGQYHIPVNLDKKEFINPHTLGAGLKQWEQLVNQPGTPQAIFALLCSSNHRGGGDLRDTANGVLGRWAGDRIAVVGDYSEPDDIPGIDAREVANAVFNDEAGWTDISYDVAELLEAEFEGKYSDSVGWRQFHYNPGGLFSDRIPEEQEVA